MRKIISSLAMVGVSYTFSFYKMDHVIVHELSSNIRDVSIINQDKVLDIVKQKHSSKSLNVFVYDPHLRYGLSFGGYDDFVSSSFDNYRTKRFNRKGWEQNFNPVTNTIPNFYEGKQNSIDFRIINFDLDSSEINKLNHSNLSNESVIYMLGGQSHRYTQKFTYTKPIVLESRGMYERSLVEVCTEKNGVKLKDSTGKVIDFERVFKNYVRKQKELYETDLPHVIVRLIIDSETPDINDKNEIETRSVSEMIKLNKFTYTNDQIELLNNSKIIAIYALPEKKCSNEMSVENWNNGHPNDIKEAEYKKINRIIIGYALDKRDNTAFNFVTDLGEDISVLFDYDKKDFDWTTDLNAELPNLFDQMKIKN